MTLEVILRAARILRAQPACSMPLARLHEILRNELGPDAGTYTQIYVALKKRPHSFTFIDPPHLLSESDTWPAQVREEYRSALAGAGMGACVRVALTELSANEITPDALGLASSTVSELWTAAGEDRVLREFLERASDELAQISAQLLAAGAEEPPTIPVPDPPP